jgi:hypothetical protein
MVGFLSHASVGQLADRMGHMPISSHLSATIPSAQTTMVPSEVNSMQYMQPNTSKQPRGKKKRNKNNIFNIEPRITSTKNNQGGGMKEKNKGWFPNTTCGEDHPTHNCPWKNEVHCFLAQQKAPQ